MTGQDLRGAEGLWDYYASRSPYGPGNSLEPGNEWWRRDPTAGTPQVWLDYFGGTGQFADRTREGPRRLGDQPSGQPPITPGFNPFFGMMRGMFGAPRMRPYGNVGAGMPYSGGLGWD